MVIIAEKTNVVEAMALGDKILAIQEADLELKVVQMELLSSKSSARTKVTPSSHVEN